MREAATVRAGLKDISERGLEGTLTQMKQGQRAPKVELETALGRLKTLSE